MQRHRHFFRLSKHPNVPIVALALWLAIGTVAVVTAQSELETPSPATGSAQVISQGMTNRPALSTSWRVVRRPIPVRADARPSDRLEGSVGFLLADGAAIFVTDQDTKQRYRLAPGEAQFVPIGANQTWASLDDLPATAYSLELSDRERIDEAGDGDVIFRSRAFGMKEGDYDLDLLRNRLPYHRRAQLDATAFPVLIFVTQGQIDVVSGGGNTKRLRSNQAGAFSGDVRIQTQSKNDAVYVVSVVTTSIGGGRTAANPTATPAPTDTPTQQPTLEPTPTPDPEEELTGGNSDAEPTRLPTLESLTGINRISLELRLCPAGTTPEDFDPDSCAQAEGGFGLALESPFGETLRIRNASRADDDEVVWRRLKAGVYELRVTKFPNGYVDWSLDEFVCCPTGRGFEITVERGDQLIGTIYFFRPVE